MREIFTGELNGHTASSLSSMIDYNVQSIEGRKKVIDSIIDTGFFEIYFDNHFKYNPTSNQPLSDANNVCYLLEKMSDYLLTSDESIEENKKDEYIYYSNRNHLEKKLNQEQNIRSMITIDSLDFKANIIHNLDSDSVNKISKNKEVEITEEDYNNGEMGEILKSYKKVLDQIDKELRNPNSKNNRYVLTNQKYLVKEDMKLIKLEYIDNVIGRATSIPVQSFDAGRKMQQFDFTNEIHLRGISYTKYNKSFRSTGLLHERFEHLTEEDPISFVLYDLKTVIDKANLTSDELEVLKLTQNGMLQIEIAHKMDRSQSFVSKCFDRVVNKIEKVGDRYDYEYSR